MFFEKYYIVSVQKSLSISYRKKSNFPERAIHAFWIETLIKFLFLPMHPTQVKVKLQSCNAIYCLNTQSHWKQIYLWLRLNVQEMKIFLELRNY